MNYSFDDHKPKVMTPKSLQPGNNQCKLLSMKLEVNRFDNAAVNLILELEGPDMGADFQGFAIDKQNPLLGNHKGQVASVKSSYFTYKNREYRGEQITKDQDVMKFIANMATVMGKFEALKGMNCKDLFELVAESSRRLSGPEFYNFCLAGREYKNQNGYINHDLFLPKAKDGKFPITALNNTTNLMVFDANTHIVKLKEEVLTDGFATANDSHVNFSTPQNYSDDLGF